MFTIKFVNKILLTCEFIVRIIIMTIIIIYSWDILGIKCYDSSIAPQLESAPQLLLRANLLCKRSESEPCAKRIFK